MSKLQQRFLRGEFALTAEMAPPKGYDFTEALETASLLKDRVDAVNVTDMQSACLKASSLGLCIALKQAGVEPILQMTGRDRSRMAIQAEFLSAAAFGIDTVLALTGDHPLVGDCKASKPVFDLDSVGILKLLSSMEQKGTDCGGNALSSTPKFCKGAAVTPVYEPLFLQINKLKKKVDAGAEFVQTQGIFTIEALESFMNEVQRHNIKVKVMAGIIPLKAAGMARYMNENIPGICVPDHMIARLQAAAEEGKEKGIKGLPMNAGMDMAAELIREIRSRGLCEGVHIMAIGAERNVPVILDRAGL
ncbi:MAG: methylenetetrahydrofolate reductase [Oscillospiraceae bacterium]|nr:methylenetetrahydrofolate reductase [Oscillospiraceae bacterium]